MIDRGLEDSRKGHITKHEDLNEPKLISNLSFIHTHSLSLRSLRSLRSMRSLWIITSVAKIIWLRSF
jgi:hypothetical protein